MPYEVQGMGRQYGNSAEEFNRILEEKLQFNDEEQLEYARMYVENELGITRESLDSYNEAMENIFKTFDGLRKFALDDEIKNDKKNRLKVGTTVIGGLATGGGSLVGTLSGMSLTDWLIGSFTKEEDANSYKATASKLPFDQKCISSLASQLLRDERFLSELEGYFNVRQEGASLGTVGMPSTLGYDNNLLNTSTGLAGAQSAVGGAPSSGSSFMSQQSAQDGIMGGLLGNLFPLPGMSGEQGGGILGMLGLGGGEGESGGLLGMLGLGGDGESPLQPLEDALDINYNLAA